mmetsp:Transcript_39130/g.72409  ORF Transcript_39130/g.72409 Transcript_39130/m.72409 type:complete len:399 (+) Transcript_39130:71-1267(+)
MCTLFLTFVCLVCRSLGEQKPSHVKDTPSSLLSSVTRQASATERSDALRAFARLSLAFNSAAAFNPSGPAGACKGHSRLASLRPGCWDGVDFLGLRTPVAAMSELQKDAVDLESLTITVLKDKLRERSLKVTGKKEELIARLKEHAEEVQELSGSIEKALLEDAPEEEHAEEKVQKLSGNIARVLSEGPSGTPSSIEEALISGEPAPEPVVLEKADVAEEIEDLKTKLRHSIKAAGTKEALIASLGAVRQPEEAPANVAAEEKWEHQEEPPEEKKDEEPEEVEDQKTSIKFNNYKEVQIEGLFRQAKSIMKKYCGKLSPAKKSATVRGFSRHVMMDVIQRHPKAEEKIGTGVEEIFVGVSDWGSPSFHILRTDETVVDFSYRKALGITMEEEREPATV